MSEFLKSLNFPTSVLTPMLDLMDDIETFLEASKKYINKYFKTTAADIKDSEQKLSRVMAILTQKSIKMNCSICLWY